MNERSLAPTAWTTGSTEIFKTGTWRATLPRHVSAPSPCHLACPLGGDVAHWIGRARARDWRGAWEALVRNNPFPAVTGRVCHHPCEAACNRGELDGALAICRLERFVGDRALAENWQLPTPRRERGKRVAVVGAGPSGLSAAYQLRRLGYAVTLLEASAHSGGLMRGGIPAYRLPRVVLDGEIERILALGIEMRAGEALAAAGDLARLRERFDAVYLAIGARRQKRLEQLDYAQPWVVDGAQWLALANAGTPPAIGKRVVVIGGGSAAIDVARSTRRLGHDVTLLALEREAQLPAQRAEVEEALEEGVRLRDGAMLRRAAARAAGAVALECVRVSFAAGAEPGSFRVTPLAGSEFFLEADAVVPSIGQDPDLSALGELRARGALLEVDAAHETSAPRVYAGGDVASTARFVSEAIGMGKRAALAIDAALSGSVPAEDEQPAGERLHGAGTPSERPVPFSAIATFYHPPFARYAERRLDVAARLADAAEVQLGFEPGEALAESERCFSCGACVACDNCFQYCPDLAIRRVPGGYEVDCDYCKGCGICARECPCGAIEMTEELR